jgi:hypothetical protein
MSKLIDKMSQKGFKGWETVHRTGLGEAESDEMLFVYTMLSPLLGMLFPFLDKLEEAVFLDNLPLEERHKIMEYYKDCLKRHLYATGPDKLLLEKSALIAGRLNSIAQFFPDMRIVHLIRHPYQSVPSLINMFVIPLRRLAPQIKRDSRAISKIIKMIFEYYNCLLDFKKKFPREQFIEVRYEDLVADPQKTITFIYQKLNIELSKELESALEYERKKALHYKSRHSYSLEDFGLTKKKVYDELKNFFEEYGFEY